MTKRFIELLDFIISAEPQHVEKPATPFFKPINGEYIVVPKKYKAAVNSLMNLYLRLDLEERKFSYLTYLICGTSEDECGIILLHCSKSIEDFKDDIRFVKRHIAT